MEPIEDVASKLEAKTASFVKEHRLPGAAVGIVHGDALAWSTGVGFADVAARRAPDTTTLYRIASITKTFTGTAIMQLRDEGLLHLDDPAVVHLSELAAVASPFGAIETVTIRRMLSHESGLQSDPPGTDWWVPTYEGSVERNLSRAGEVAATLPPNAQQKYSNLAYQLLGEIVARRSGVPYPEYVRTRILEPLGMLGSGFEPLPETLAERCATGYAARFLSDELELASIPPTVWAEGGLWSSVDDLARWLSFQFREDGGAREGAQILADDTLKEMHTPRYLGDDAWTEAFGISWYAIRKGEVIWVQHSGGLNGFITTVCFDPREKVGAIVLFNGIGDAAELAMELGAIARDAVREAASPIEPPASMPSAYRDLLGLYVDEEQAMVVRVEWRDGALQIVDPDQATWRPTLTPTEDADVFVVAPGVRESGERVTFSRRVDGRVVSVFLAAATMVRFGPVEPA
jgi:CubicO group peptidase (beta-lactamase class C family)